MAQAQRLITADYNGLSNKPIINASLPVLPSPPANTYFRHTGSTTATFTNGVIYKWDGVEYKELGTGAQPIDLSKYIQADTLTGLLPNVQYALVHDSDNVFTLVEVEGGGTGTGWLIATSDLEVEALLINDNLGKFFMFIGESESEHYYNYALYQVVLDGNDIVPALVFASADMIADAIEDLSSDIDGKQDALISGENIKTINGESVLGEGNIAIETYQPFPAGWTVDGTVNDFCVDVNTDASAIGGMAYLGNVIFSDLPFNGNADAVVEIIRGTGTSGKVIHITITSGDRAPYKWEYTWWNNGLSISGWKSWQETLVSGTNIKTINNQSILGEGNIDIQGGGSSDYDELENTPIINQYEEREPAFVPFVADETLLHNGDKIHFATDADSTAALVSALKTLGSGALVMAHNESLQLMCMVVGDDVYMAILDGRGVPNALYGTSAGEIEGLVFEQGWQNIDADGNFTITLAEDALVGLVGDSASEPLWNGTLISLVGEIVSIEPAPVDGKYYKRPDGDLYKYVEAIVPEHLIALEDDKEVHKGFKVRFNKNLDIDTFLNGLTFPDGYPMLQLYNIGFADGEHDNEVALEQLAIMDAGAMSADLGEDAKGILLVAGIDRILYATESGSLMGMDAVTEEVITISYTQGWNTDFVDENGDYEPQFLSVVYGENPHYSTFEDGVLGVSNQLNQELWNGVLIGEVAPAEDKSVYDKVVLQSELKKEEGSMPTFANEAEAIAFAKEENFGKVAQYVGENQLAQTTISYADRFTVVINKAAFISALSDQAGEVEFIFNGTSWLPDISDYGITVSGDAIEGDKFIAVYHGDGTFHTDDVVTQIFYADGADFSKVFTYSQPQAFVSHNYMKSGDKFHFDTTGDFDTFLAGLSYDHNMCTLVGGEDYFGLIAGSASDVETGDTIYIVAVTKTSTSFDIIYSTGTFEGNDGTTYTRGWYNLDANGDYRISLAEDNEISLPNDGAWNGTLIGLKTPTNATTKNFIKSLNQQDFDYIASFNKDTFGAAVNHLSGYYKFRYDFANGWTDLYADYEGNGYWNQIASNINFADYGITLDNPVYPDEDRDFLYINYACEERVLDILGFTGDDDGTEIIGNYVATIDGNLAFDYNSYDIGGTGHVKGIDGESLTIVKDGVVSAMAPMIFTEFVDSLTITLVVAQSSWDDLMSKTELPSILATSQLVSRLEVEVDTNRFATNSGAKVGKAFKLLHKDGEWQTSLPVQGTPISEADPQGGSVSIYCNTALDVDEVAGIFDTAPFTPTGGGSGEAQAIFTYSTPDQGERGAYLYSFMGSWIVMIQDQNLGEVPIVWSNSEMLSEYLGIPAGWIMSNFTITTTNGISVTEGYEDILAQLLSLTPFEAGYEAVDVDTLGISVEGEAVDGDKLDITLLDSAYKKSEFYRVDAKDENLGANIGDEITTLYFDTNSRPVFSDFLNYTEFPLNRCGVFYASNTYATTGETDGLFYVSLYDLGVSGASEEDIVIGTHMRSENLVPSSIVYSSIACTVDINGEQASVSQGWSVDHYTYDPPFVAIGNEGYFSVYPVIMEENIKAIQKYVHIKPFDYVPEKIYYLYKFYLSPDESAGGGSVVVDLGNVISKQEGQFSPSDEVFELLANGATTVKLSAGSIECYATLVEHGTFAEFYNAEFYFFKGAFHDDPEYLIEDEGVYDLTVALSPDMDGAKFGYYTFNGGSGSGVSSIGSLTGDVQLGLGLGTDNGYLVNSGVVRFKKDNGSGGYNNLSADSDGYVELGDGLDISNSKLVATGGASYSAITMTYNLYNHAFYTDSENDYDTIRNGKLFALLFNSVYDNNNDHSYRGSALMSSLTENQGGNIESIIQLLDTASSTTVVSDIRLVFNPRSIWDSSTGESHYACFDSSQLVFADGSTITVLRLL